MSNVSLPVSKRWINRPRSLSDLPLKHLIFSELRFLVILKKQFKISILLIKSDRLLELLPRNQGLSISDCRNC